MNNGKLIQQFGKLVEQGHPPELCAQSRFSAEGRKRFRVTAGWQPDEQPAWGSTDLEYRVAITFLEGKPVFDGDTYYDAAGNECSAHESQRGYIFPGCTLTPPTPKPEIPEGFTAWHGVCVWPVNTLVEVILRDGGGDTDNSNSFRWKHRGTAGDIIAYRIIKPTTFELNGEVLPLPDYVGKCREAHHHCILISNQVWWYKSREDADRVDAAFAKLGRDYE